MANQSPTPPPVQPQFQIGSPPPRLPSPPPLKPAPMNPVTLTLILCGVALFVTFIALVSISSAKEARAKEQAQIQSKLEIEKKQAERKAKEVYSGAQEPELPAVQLFESEVVFSSGVSVVGNSLKAVENQYFTEITGIAINRYGGDLRYAQVEISLYDFTGTRVGSTIANITNLKPGETWRFKAVSFEKFDRFRVSDITAF